jgi:nucleoside-diphosphate-sugar epimerase
MTGKVALITGANGITGSAIARHLCENTSSSEWSKILITSRSPLSLAFTDPRMTFIAMDFSKTPDDLARIMGKECTDVTHAYFSSYVHHDDFAELNRANGQLFEHFLEALTRASRKLQNVTLQTGGKHYQVHLMPVPSPAREDEERIEAQLPNFYFPQEDALIASAKKHNFSWNVIRPEAIIGGTNKPSKFAEVMYIVEYSLILRTSHRWNERGAYHCHVLHCMCLPEGGGHNAHQPALLGRDG